MNRRWMVSAGWLLLVTSTSLHSIGGPGQSPSSEPIGGEAQFRTILQKVVAHQGETDRKLEGFGYTESLKREEDGKVKKLDVYQVSIYKGRKVRRLISRNGKPLAGSDLAKEDKRVESEVRNLENGNIPPLSNRRIKLEDLLHCSMFTNVRQGERDGRTVWFADFHPNPQVKPANSNEQFVYNLDGKIGVDAAALQLVSFDFLLRKSFNIAGGLWFSMKPGARYSDQQDWLFSSIWLPRTKEFNMRAQAMIGVKLLIDETSTYSDFRKFDVSANGSVTPPKR